MVHPTPGIPAGAARREGTCIAPHISSTRHALAAPPPLPAGEYFDANSAGQEACASASEAAVADGTWK